MVFDVPSLDQTFGANSLLQVRLQETLQKRFSAKVQVLHNEAVGRDSLTQLERDKWDAVRSSISTAKNKISAAVDAIKSARTAIGPMRTALYKAGTATTPEDVQAQATVFQSFFNVLVSGLQSGQYRTPLLSASSIGNTVSYKTDVAGFEQVEKGKDLVPFYSLSTETVVWKTDRKQNILQKYENGELANYAASLTTGIRLDGINGDGTVNFTVGASTANPEVYTNAALSESGLNFKDVWYYDNLSTQDGRDRAQAALDAAENYLKAYEQQFSSMVSVAEFYDNRAQAAISAIDNRGIAVQEKLSAQVKELQETAQRENQVLSQAMASSAVTQQSYSAFFSAGGRTKAAKLFDSIFKITA